MPLLPSLKEAIPDRHPLRLLWHRAKTFLAAVRYGFPALRLTVIGITGTDGKTTTVGMAAHILREAGFKTGALSTAFFQIGETLEWNATQKTSPSPFLVQRFLRRLVHEHCTHAVIEYSSHGLTQGRTLFTWPRIAAITNLAEEHLDYHGSMEEYLAAKALLFRMLSKRGTKVLNGADTSFESLRLIPSLRTVVCGGEDDRQSDVHLSLLDSGGLARASAMIAVREGKAPMAQRPLTLAIPGTFNLENALTAIGCAIGCGVGVDKAIDALRSFPGIPGRMEAIDEGQDFSVFVDFTVTPQSYEKTLSTIRAGLPSGHRLLVLTGSCGDRMREKRPIVGKIVSTYADVTVVTNEDPYTEDPAKIIDEVWAGIDRSRTQAHRIPDREQAIEFLLSQARPGDTVLLCGKGSDTTMWTKDGRIPWDERGIIRRKLRRT